MGKITINCSFDVGVDSVYAGCNSNNIKTTEKGSEKAVERWKEIWRWLWKWMDGGLKSLCITFILALELGKRLDMNGHIWFLSCKIFVLVLRVYTTYVIVWQMTPDK